MDAERAIALPRLSRPALIRGSHANPTSIALCGTLIATTVVTPNASPPVIMHAALPTPDLQLAVPEFSVVLLLSAAVAVVAAVIVWLARAPRTVHRHVCRLGRHAARIDLRRTRGPLTVSIRRMDDQHVWIAVDGQAETLVSDDVSHGRCPRPIT